MRAFCWLLFASLVALADEPNPGDLLSGAFGSLPQVKQAKVKGNMASLSLDGSHVRREFEGETQAYEASHLKVVGGRPMGAEVWSRQLRRAYSEDGKAWADATLGKLGETWHSFMAPEDVIALVKSSFADATLAGQESVGGVECYTVKVTLKADAVAQLIPRLGTSGASVDAEKTHATAMVRVARKEYLLYGIELSMSGVGNLPPGANDPEPPKDPSGEGVLGKGAGQHGKAAEPQRAVMTYNISYDFSDLSDKEPPKPPVEVRKILAW